MWAQNLALPASNDPFAGTCIPFVRNVIAPHPGETGTARCNATPSTRLFVFFGSFWSALEEPFPETEEEQLAAAVAADQAIHELNVTVDRRQDRQPRQATVRALLAADERCNCSTTTSSGVPAQTTTFTAHAWGAVIRKLRPGRHTVTFEVVAPDWGDPFTSTVILNVVPGHSDGGDHADHG